MSDLISRQAAIDAMSRISDSICEAEAVDALCELPTVDAVPVRHGKWVNANEGRWNTCEVLKCSECGELDNRMYKTDKYCPNCGADMRGEE